MSGSIETNAGSFGSWRRHDVVLLVITAALLSLSMAVGQQAESQVAAPVSAAQPVPNRVEFDEDNYKTPVRDAYAHLWITLLQLERSDAEQDQQRAAQLRAKEDDLRRAMLAERAELNGLIFERRQQELRRRARAETPEGRKLGFDVLTYPRVNGSTSTHPLEVLIACRLLGAEYEWTDKYDRPSSYYGGESSARYFDLEGYLAEYWLLAKTTPLAAARLGAIINRQIAVHQGTHEGYEALFRKTADFALIARRPSTEELREAALAGVAFDVQPVALDAFVFIVNHANHVSGLTSAQIRDVYSGLTRNWSTLGGVSAEISAYQREPTSGSQELMVTLFMQGRPLRQPSARDPERRLLESTMAGVFNALLEDPNGIAYTVYYYEHFMSASPYTKTLAVDGVRPSYETIRNGTYPYGAEVYCVIRADEPPNSGARRLRDWLLSDEGQAVVEESGYVPLPRSPATRPGPATTPARTD